MKNTKAFEFAQHLKTDKDIKQYIDIQIQENGIQGLIDAPNVLTKKSGFSNIAKNLELIDKACIVL